MKRRFLAVSAACLAGILALAFVFPGPMLAPGALIPAHSGLASDCFACHAPLQGADAARCTTCHALPGIGLRTVAGVPILRSPPVPAFHQGLADTNCMACHTDHPLPGLVPMHSHAFVHAMLAPATAAACSGCHAAPADALHAGNPAQCSTCHSQTGWAGARMDHTRFFDLAAPHDAACTTCHTTSGDFSRFTCYGCHAHSEAGIIALHREEGITNTANCVTCHRSAHAGDDDARGEGREGTGDDENEGD